MAMKVNTFGQSQVIDTSWRGLMTAVIAQAIADLRASDPVKVLDAILFLMGDDLPLWAEAVGAPDIDGIQFVISGRGRSLGTVRKS
jgi:hypothetical protein